MDRTKLIIPKRPPLITQKLKVKTVKDLMIPSDNRTYIPVPFIQSIFPQMPVDGVVWDRESERYQVMISSGYYTDKTPIGLPYGSKTRMILCAITKEVGRTESPEVHLGDSMNQLMRSLGFKNFGGGENSDRHGFEEQMVRLFNSNIHIFDKRESEKPEDLRKNKRKKTPARNIAIVTRDDSQSQSSWNKTVTIGDDFFKILMKYDKVPLDLTHMKELKRSPLQLDLYAWLTWASYLVWATGDEGEFISWDELRVTFSNYTENYDFKRRARPALENIQKVYKRLKIVVDDHLGIQFRKDTLPAVDPKDKLILD